MSSVAHMPASGKTVQEEQIAALVEEAKSEQARALASLRLELESAAGNQQADAAVEVQALHDALNSMRMEADARAAADAHAESCRRLAERSLLKHAMRRWRMHATQLKLKRWASSSLVLVNTRL